jgi:hypothetical protein
MAEAAIRAADAAGLKAAQAMDVATDRFVSMRFGRSCILLFPDVLRLLFARE